MKKLSAVLLLFGVACFVASFWVVRAEKQMTISEQLRLRPIDPTPIAVAFVNSHSAPTNPPTIELKDWKFSKAGNLFENVLELGDGGSALSHSFPIQPGCYYFQMDEKTSSSIDSRRRSLVAAGNASFGFFHDSAHANDNREWMTFSHFFRIPETENTMQIGMKTYPDSGQPRVHIKNIKLLPAQALLNLAPKNQPLEDIYWGKNAVARTEPTGEFLPLGRMEKIEQDFKTKRSVYHFRWEKGSADPWSWSNVDWGFASSGKTETYFPPVPLEARPIEKIVCEPTWTTVDKYDEVIFKFELCPISIGANGEFNILPPIRFLSGRISGNGIGSHAENGKGIFWSTDGKTWNALKLETKIVNGQWTDYPPLLSSKIFPCERFYLKFKAVDGIPDLSQLSWLHIDAELDTDQYCDYGRTSYFRVIPPEMEDTIRDNVWPLYTARNQVYFLFRNETQYEHAPQGFTIRLVYNYSEQEEPKEVLFYTFAGQPQVEEFDDMTCHWEILSKGGTIPPGEERIGVFTLETSKLRASSHHQEGSYISDVFSVEFGFDGRYKMINEQMRFFPPRLAIE